MEFWNVIHSQLLDPFRIGLLIALVATMQQTAAQTGRVIPLLLGAVFVAVLIPSVMSSPAIDSTTATLAGLVTNAIILAVLLALLFLWQRFFGAKRS